MTIIIYYVSVGRFLVIPKIGAFLTFEPFCKVDHDPNKHLKALQLVYLIFM